MSVTDPCENTDDDMIDEAIKHMVAQLAETGTCPCCIARSLIYYGAQRMCVVAGPEQALDDLHFIGHFIGRAPRGTRH
jgi:hypothetical protein